MILHRALSELLAEGTRNGLTKPKRIRGTGVKMIGMGEIFANFRIGNIEMERVPVTNKELENYCVQPNDLLFARQSLKLEGAGKCSIIVAVNEPTVFESHLIRVRIDESVANPVFVYYFFNSPFGHKYVMTIVEQVAAAGLRASDLVKLKVPCPNIEIQNKSAYLLKMIDDKIALNQQINKNLEEQAQAIYKAWFIDRIGPPYSSKIVSLATLMDYSGGSQPPASEFIYEDKEGYDRFVQIRDYDTDDHITYIPKSRKNKLCDEHDIMIARYGASLGRICFGINGAYNVALAKVFPVKEYYREFLRCYLSSHVFFEGINNKGGRSAQAGFNASDIKSFEIDFPTDNIILIQFEKSVAPLFEYRLHILKENRRLANLRDALLPRLMSGEIDVSKIEL